MRRIFLLRYGNSTFGKINHTIRHSCILDVRILGEFPTIMTLILKDTDRLSVSKQTISENFDVKGCGLKNLNDVESIALKTKYIFSFGK